MYFDAEADKIWAQAGLVIDFLPLARFFSTAFRVLDDEPEVTNLWNQAGHGQSTKRNAINMWFVVGDVPCAAVQAYACAEFPGNDIAVGSSTFDFNGGNGRRDTPAHEIGHNLGLDHGGGVDNLMYVGDPDRNIPGGLGDITPDGGMFDQLTAAEIATVRRSPLLVPEPSILLLLCTGFGLLGFVSRRRAAMV